MQDCHAIGISAISAFISEQFQQSFVFGQQITQQRYIPTPGCTVENVSASHLLSCHHIRLMFFNQILHNRKTSIRCGIQQRSQTRHTLSMRVQTALVNQIPNDLDVVADTGGKQGRLRNRRQNRRVDLKGLHYVTQQAQIARTRSKVGQSGSRSRLGLDFDFLLDQLFYEFQMAKLAGYVQYILAIVRQFVDVCPIGHLMMMM